MPTKDLATERNAGAAFIALSVVFMATVNVGLGAAFLAIGAALIAKGKSSDDAS